MAFRATLQRFQAAVNIPGLSSKVKIAELSHWFGGVAAELIASYAAFDDADIAFQGVISELGFIYGGNTESMAPIINELKAGKTVPKNDHKAHIMFYSELVRVESHARAMRQIHQLNNFDTLAEIVESRLKHAANKWWQEDLKCQQDGSPRQNFDSLKKIVQDSIFILGSRKALTVPPMVTKSNATESSTPTTSQPQPQHQQNQQQQQLSRRQLKLQRQQQRQAQAEMNLQHQHLPGQKAGESQPPLKSYLAAFTDSPPKQQEKCICCGGPHKTDSCQKLWAMDMDARLKWARDNEICLKCLTPGHVGRDCPNPATCSVCSRPGHHGLFHGRPFKKPTQQTPSINANAMSFIPAVLQNPADSSQSAPISVQPPLAPSAPASSDSNNLLL